MKVSIPDALYEELGDSEAELLKILDRAKPLVDKEALVISARCRFEISEVLGGLPIRSGADIRDRIRLLADIQIGKIRLDFTRQELLEIKHRAEKRGWTVQQYLSEIVDQVKAQWFDVQVRSNPTAPPPAA